MYLLVVEQSAAQQNGDYNVANGMQAQIEGAMIAALWDRILRSTTDIDEGGGGGGKSGGNLLRNFLDVQ